MGQTQSGPQSEQQFNPTAAEFSSGAPGCSGAGPSAEEQEPSGEAEPVPTVLQWSAGGNAVFVTGSFNAWEERIPLRRSGTDHVVCLNLPPGTYQYKFIVDNEWRFATDQPTVRDEMGNINNCITVIDQAMYLHEHAASGFFGDTPHNMYTQSLPDEITLAKEPPLAPLQLSCIALNTQPAPDPRIAGWTLPTPLSALEQVKCPSWQDPRSAPAPPHGTPGGSDWFSTPRGRDRAPPGGGLLRPLRLPSACPATGWFSTPKGERGRAKTARLGCSSEPPPKPPILFHRLWPTQVILTHMCLTPRGATATTMSVTHRFRNKFVTVVIYKPRLAPSAAPAAAAAAASAAASAASAAASASSASASFAMGGGSGSNHRGVGMDMEEDDPYADESRAPGHDRLMPPPPGGMWAPGGGGGGGSPSARPPFLQEGSSSRKVSWSDLPRAASAAGSAAMDIGSRPPSQAALFMDLT